MDPDGSLMMIIALTLLVLCSAFFSASEMAYSSLNRVRIRLKAEDGDRAAQQALRLTEEYDALLSTILIGNNVVNIVATAMATVLFTQWLGGSGPAWSSAVLTVLILIFGEVTPKSLAKEHPEDFAMFAAPALNILVTLCRPVNALFRAWKSLLRRIIKPDDSADITEDELIGIVQEAENVGALDQDESELIRSAIEFDDVEVGTILTHRVDICAVPDTVTPQELYENFSENGYSRLPVYHGSIDNIIGVILEKDFYPMYIRGGRDVSSLIQPVEYTTETAKVSDLLTLLQKKQTHIAVVLDEYGGTEGIVTMEDILEELVGEIWDEHEDAEKECVQQQDGTWLVSGSMSMEDFAERFGLSGETDSDTVGGWVLSLIGSLPHEGCTLSRDGLDIVVARVTKRRILQIRVKKQNNEEQK